MTPPRQVLPALTGLRAWAAVWVMLLHLQHGRGIEGHVVLGPVVDHGFWAVDVFFVLSGFILSLLYAPRFGAGIDRREFRGYLAARFARIYPLHLLALGLLAAWAFGRALLRGTPLPPAFAVEDFFLNLTLLHGWGFADRITWNFPSWSIGTEWFAYLVMLPLLARGLRRASVAQAVALGLAAWTVVYALLHARGLMVGSQNVHWGIPRIAAEFALGYGLYRLYAQWRPSPRLADALVAGGGGAIVALCYAPPGAEWLLAPAVMALVLGLTAPGPLGATLFGSRLAVFWGERSYSIYMLHAIVQIGSNIALARAGIGTLDAGAAWLLFATQAAAVLLVSHLAYGWVEVPMRERWRARLAPAAPREPAPSARTEP